MSRLWASGRAWWSWERGTAMPAILILSLPLIIGAFGWGFDSMRVAFLKNWIQTRVEMAAQTGTTATYTNPSNGRLYLGRATDGVEGYWARQVAGNNYIANTSTKRGDEGPLTCPTPAIDALPTYVVTEKTSSPRTVDCGLWVNLVGSALPIDEMCSPESLGNVYGLVVKANEQVPYTFLRIIGLDTADFHNITGTSYVRARAC